MKERNRKITFEARGWKRPAKMSRFPSSSIVELNRTSLLRFILAKDFHLLANFIEEDEDVFQKVSPNVTWDWGATIKNQISNW